jgi:HSP20 family protein
MSIFKLKNSPLFSVCFVIDEPAMKRQIFSDMSSFRHELEDFVRHISLKRNAAFSHPGTWCPNLDVFESEEKIILLFELAGVSKDDVEIELHHDHLLVKGIRRVERGSGGHVHHQVEILDGRFERAIPLPPGIKGGKVNAKMEEGILRIDLLKEKQNSKVKEEKIIVRFK